MKRFAALLSLFVLSFTLMGCDRLWSDQVSDLMNNTDSYGNGEQSPDQPMEKMEKEPQQPTENESIESGFTYEDYSEERFNELKGNRPVVLNFHADWCPNCRALDKLVKENLARLPENAVMLKVNYDKATALKQQYGITVQTTLVFFNAQGEQVAKEFNPKLEKMIELLAS
ncbi:MAG: thioredoxin family protein [Candidatus Altimarinota bacterium]